MATSPITAKIFAGEALMGTEKKRLTQEQEWLHLLLQAGISNIRTWAEFQGHAIWRCFHTYGTTDVRTIMEWTNEDINSLQCVLTTREKRQLAADGYPYADVMPLSLQYKRKLRILIAAYNSFCRQYNRDMKPYNITKAAIDEFRLTDYRIGSPLVHWTSLGSDEARERKSWSKSIKRNKKDYSIFKHEASFRHWYEETVDTRKPMESTTCWNLRKTTSKPRRRIPRSRVIEASGSTSVFSTWPGLPR